MLVTLLECPHFKERFHVVCDCLEYVLRITLSYYHSKC